MHSPTLYLTLFLVLQLYRSVDGDCMSHYNYARGIRYQDLEDEYLGNDIDTEEDGAFLSIMDTQSEDILSAEIDVNKTKSKFIQVLRSDEDNDEIDAHVDPEIRSHIKRELMARNVPIPSHEESLDGKNTEKLLRMVDEILSELSDGAEKQEEHVDILGDNQIIKQPMTYSYGRKLIANPTTRTNIRDLIGKTVDLTRITQKRKFSLRGRKLNLRALTVNESFAEEISPNLMGRSFEEAMYIWSAVATLTDLVNERNDAEYGIAEKVHDIEHIPLLWEGDIYLETDDVARILDSIIQDPSTLDLSPQTQDDDLPYSTQPLESDSDDTTFSDRVKAELTPFVNEIFRGHEHSRTKRKIFRDAKRKWPIPVKYRYATKSLERIYQFRQAKAIWKYHTCIRFRKVAPTYVGNHIRLQTNGSGCYSLVGRQVKRIFGQPINLGGGCGGVGTILHELGHTLGFMHEQSRPDRDRYITVNISNVSEKFKGQFIKLPWLYIQVFGVPYDYASIMHYTTTAFGINGKIFTPTEKEMESSIGQEYDVSFFDVKLANYYYCADSCKEGLTWSACKNGGYRDPNDCSKCKCSDGWMGTYCDEPMNHVTCVYDICGPKDLAATSDWQYLESPRYSESKPSYSRYDRCTWRVTAPQGKRVELEFVSPFDLHCSGTCQDYAEVRYADKGRPGPRFCCDKTPSSTLISHGTEMLILFRANRGFSGADRGFRAKYRSSGCGGCATGASSTEPICYRTEEYSCPGEYTEKCGPLKLRKCKRTEPNTCFRTVSYCCEGYTKDGEECKSTTPT